MSQQHNAWFIATSEEKDRIRRREMAKMTSNDPKATVKMTQNDKVTGKNDVGQSDWEK